MIDNWEKIGPAAGSTTSSVQHKGTKAMEDNKLIFSHDGPCVIIHTNIAFGHVGRTAATAVRVYEGGRCAQHDRHLEFVYDLPKKPRQRKVRSESAQVVLDGLIGRAIEIDGEILYNSAWDFPIYATLEDARRYAAVSHELSMSRIKGEITVDEHFELFRALTKASTTSL